ncbi:hypothetical protein [Thermosynechococcus sp.]|uniref:hypothetical protein n=1 Tax=Thermosynechococcus sp. TaxID=2814275 RepID=UPI00391CF931
MNGKWLLVFGFSASAWLPLAATAQSSPSQWQIEARPTTNPTFEVAPTAEAPLQWQAVPEPSSDRPWQPATPEELAQPILPPVAEQAPAPIIAEEPQYRIPPLMRPPTRLFNLETANILPEQNLELRGGFAITIPKWPEAVAVCKFSMAPLTMPSIIACKSALVAITTTTPWDVW